MAIGLRRREAVFLTQEQYVPAVGTAHFPRSLLTTLPRMRCSHLPPVFAIASHAPCLNAWSLEKATVNWVTTSKLISDLHEEHVASEQVCHVMKSTPLVNAPDAAKMNFANGPFGRAMADLMKAEQSLLGDWKLGKIVEAAGEDFDASVGHRMLLDVLNHTPVTVFSFVDCPWCLLAKQLLKDEYHLNHGDGILQVIELEDLGRNGKKLRAAIALATGRTSMPACFISGKSVGGFTDGFERDTSDDYVNTEDSGFAFVPSPESDLRCVGSPGLAELHNSGRLATLLK